MNTRSQALDQSRRDVSFTPAESRVLPLLATYLTLGGIATRLGVRRSTVKSHVASIYKKLGVTKRAEAVEVARAAGLLAAAPRLDDDPPVPSAPSARLTV
jgi:LuxR family transcriptional regulator, maltose regulon positive regulatory protein